MVTGGVGLAAMLWLYGVAWHEPMTESIVAAKSAVAGWMPSTPGLLPRGFQGDVGKIGSLDRGSRSASRLSAPDTGSVNDADTTALFADRQARLALLRGEGPRMLNAGNWRRAAELCRAWSDLEFWNAEPWRCLGYSLQAQGYHQEAIAAFRKAAAIRSARQHARSGDRQKPARHRHRLPEPLSPLTSLRLATPAARHPRRWSAPADAWASTSRRTASMSSASAAVKTWSSALAGSAPASAKTMMLSRKIISVGIERMLKCAAIACCVLGVDLGEPDLRILDCGGGEHRRERTARRAPRRPEIDDRERMIVDRLGEILLGELDDLLCIGHDHSLSKWKSVVARAFAPAATCAGAGKRIRHPARFAAAADCRSAGRTPRSREPMTDRSPGCAGPARSTMSFSALLGAQNRQRTIQAPRIDFTFELHCLIHHRFLSPIQRAGLPAPSRRCRRPDCIARPKAALGEVSAGLRRPRTRLAKQRQ